MQAVFRFTIFILIGVYTTSFSLACAQDGQTLAVGIEQNNEFQVQTSLALSLQGFHQRTTFKLVDENEVPYDVMSLVNSPGVATSIGLSKEQHQQMLETAYDTQQLIEENLAGIISEDGRAAVEETFRELQTDLYSMMDDDQIDRLHQAQVKLGIEKVGLETYLASSQVRERTGLSETQLASVSNNNLKTKAQLREKTKDLTKQANEAVLEQLDDQQLAKLDEILDPSSLTQLMETDLILPKKTLEGKPRRNYATLVGHIRSRSVREDAKIDQAQYESLKLVKRHARKKSESEIQESVEEVLTPEQNLHLSKITALEQIESLGTVNSICFGVISDMIGLDEAKANGLFETGKEISSELAADIQIAKEEFLREALGTVDNEKTEEFIKIASQVDFLKSKK